MKLIRYGKKGMEKPGVLIDGQRKDCAPYFQDWNRDFFAGNGLQQLQKLIAEKGHELANIPDHERWGPCVARPGMIMCIGLNYSDHARESGMEVPKEPVLFMKATNTLQGPYDQVTIPKNSSKTDWEVELAIVLNQDVSYLKDEQAAEDAIAGYCIMHDVSEREFQLERGGQWVKGKSCPGFSPVGPWLATKDELADVLNLGMKLKVNGQVMQSGSTSTMVFNPAFVVYYLSQFMTLEAGDLITTGTPPGVGLGMKPPVYLKANDVVELSIDGLGIQKQEFIAFGQGNF